MMRKERKRSVTKLALLDSVDYVGADTSFQIGSGSNFCSFTFYKVAKAIKEHLQDSLRKHFGTHVLVVLLVHVT